LFMEEHCERAGLGQHVRLGEFADVT
jgi:hypothetical protein